MRSLRANLLYMDEIVKTFNFNLESTRLGFGGGDRLTDVPLTSINNPARWLKKGTKAVKKIFVLVQFKIVLEKSWLSHLVIRPQ